MMLNGQYLYLTVPWDLDVHIAWWHFTWPLWERFKRGVVWSLKFDTRTNNSYVTWPTKHIIDHFEIKLQCGKTDRNIRQNVVREWSCEWWLEKMWNGCEIFVAKGEGNLLEDCGTHFEVKYWCNYLTLFDTIFTCIEARKIEAE